MSQFLISYDLRKQRNYQPLWDLLRASSAVKVLESVWLLNSNAGAGAIRDHLMTVIDKDDGVIVLPLEHGAEWGSYGSLTAGVAWLNSNVRRYAA